MKNDNQISLFELVSALNRIDDKKLEVNEVVSDVSTVIMFKTIGDMEKAFNFDIGSTKSMQNLLKKCRTKVEIETLHETLFRNTIDIKRDYTLTHILALNYQQREKLYEIYPRLKKFMQIPLV